MFEARQPSLLLCMAPSWGVEMPPISIATLVRALRDQGVKVDGRDLNIECYHKLPQKADFFWDKSNLHYWVNPKLFAENLFDPLDSLFDDLADELAYGQWDVIGFTVISSNVIFINHLIHRIKLRQPDKIIIVGGPCLSFKEERARLCDEIDYFVAGEGEDSLAEFMQYIQGNLRDLPMSIYPSRNCDLDLPFRECKDLTQFGIPDYSIFPLSLYTLDALPLIFTRSCLFKCRFCGFKSVFRGFGKYIFIYPVSFNFNDLLSKILSLSKTFLSLINFWILFLEKYFIFPARKTSNLFPKSLLVMDKTI